MFRSVRRVVIAVLLALPGIGLAFIAKPLNLGEGFLLLGVLLAFVVPVLVAVSAPLPRADSPQLPRDATEAERVYNRWDSLNGRYYFKADIAVEGGLLLRDVIFDGDTQLAVLVGRRRISLEPGLLGRRVVAWLVTQDCSCGFLEGQRYGDATAEQRAAFWQAHSGGPGG
jgi:hypothetical protein